MGATAGLSAAAGSTPSKPLTPLRRALWLALAVPALISCDGGSGGITFRPPSKPGPTNPPPSSIVVSILPATASVTLGESQQFIATVTGTTNTAVTWQVEGMTGGDSNVGSVSSSGLYSAPFSVPIPATVLVTAVSQADAAKSASATVTIKSRFPVEVSISPATAKVPVGKTQQFTAAVINTSDAAVTWQVKGVTGGNATVGTISTSGLYIAPAAIPNPATVMVTAISHADDSKSASATVTITNPTANDSLLNGQYAFLFSGFDSGGPVAIGGTFAADGNGNLKDGIEDINRSSGLKTSLPFVGTYNLGADKRGTLTLASELGTSKFRFAFDSHGKGTFIEFDDPFGTGTRGSGVIKKQNAAAFSLSAFNGDFALGLAGDLAGSRMGAAGRFSTDTSGVVSNGTADFGFPAQNVGPLALTGNLGASDAHGRGTVALNIAGLPAGVSGSFTFAYYVISASEALAVEINTRSTTVPVLSGSMIKQAGAPFSDTSLDGDMVFALTGFDQILTDSSMTIGQLAADGAGNITGALDQNDGETITSDTPFVGTYSVASSGRGTAALAIGLSQTESLTCYMIAPNKAFVLEGEPTSPGLDVQTGLLEPQTGGPFENASFTGQFAVSTLTPATKNVVVISGTVALDGKGNFLGFFDRSTPAGLTPDLLTTGTYSVTSTGGGSGTSPVLGAGSVPIRVISPSKFVVIAPFDAGANQGALVVFEK